MDRPDERPVLATAAVAIGVVTLLLAAVGRGWLGPDVGRGGAFCEESATTWLRQPANTISNLAFVMAGLAVAWRARDHRLLRGSLATHPWLATVYAVLLTLIGPASAAMHATQSDLGGRLDLLSMYLLAGFALGYAVMRFTRSGPVALAVVGLAVVTLGELVDAAVGSVPVLGPGGNVVFALSLLGAIGLEVALAARANPVQDKRFGGAALATMLGAFSIWTQAKDGGPLCRPESFVQGHAAWHILDALAAYLLFRHYAAEGARRSLTTS